MRKGHCEHCSTWFDYKLYSLSWEPLWCGYCERCGYAIISPNAPISGRPTPLECKCGGCFSSKAVPRCPNCTKELSPAHATTYIGNGIPPGSVSGYDWPRAWPPGPCFVINDRFVCELPLAAGAKIVPGSHS